MSAAVAALVPGGKLVGLQHADLLSAAATTAAKVRDLVATKFNLTGAAARSTGTALRVAGVRLALDQK